MLVDNNPPVMDILTIEHDGQPLNECALITSGTADIKITFKAFDAEGHLYNYSLSDGWGSGKSSPCRLPGATSTSACTTRAPSGPA